MMFSRSQIIRGFLLDHAIKIFVSVCAMIVVASAVYAVVMGTLRADVVKERTDRYNLFCATQRLYLDNTYRDLRRGQRADLAAEEFRRLFVNDAAGLKLCAADAALVDPRYEAITCMIDGDTACMTRVSASALVYVKDHAP